ncbi:MAG: argininosuccinate lyase [Lachnospirales bacterium]
MKLWEGRFSKGPDKKLNDFNSSILFDSRMYKEDIEGSIVHSQMLRQQGIITKVDGDKIKVTLEEILKDLEEGILEIDPESEDIHTFVEGELTKRIDVVGKRLHTARSRNDQVAVDIRLYLKKEIKEIVEYIKELINVLCNKSIEEKNTVMPGYTHLQRSQPITFGHHLMAYSNMLFRDIKRLINTLENMDECPLGAGALAGTTYNIDRFFTAENLGFSKPTENSLDSVSDRDFIMELLSDLSIIMVHLSRFSEEVILWCSWEFKFVELDDGYSTGSSIMPQKKNPDIPELIRGKAGRVFGDLQASLTFMKGLSLAYNKDMQEDKECVFDGVDTVKLCLSIFIDMIKTMKTIPENMRNAAAKGFINATDCADFLVKNGMAFRDAYKITGQLVAKCISENTTLENLPMEAFKEYSHLFNHKIYEAISLEKCVEDRKSYGGPSPESIVLQVENMRGKLNSL